MALDALLTATALLHGAHDQLSSPGDGQPAADTLAVRASLIGWLVAAPGTSPDPQTLGDAEDDLREALRLLTDEVDHRDLPIDVLVTARRWLSEAIGEALPLAPT